MMDQSIWLPITVALCVTTAGAVTDIWQFRVYNALTVPLLVSGLIYHAAINGWSGFVTSSSGVVFGFSVLIVPYVLGMMGGGDVKLMAGVGAWLGFRITVVVFVVSALVAGIYATIQIIVRGQPRESLTMMKLIFYRFAALGTQFAKDDLVEEMAIRSDRRLRLIPFGAMMPLGIIGAMIWLA